MKYVFIVLCAISQANLIAQPGNVFTSDVRNFWRAFDSVHATRDKSVQLNFIQTIYFNPGTKGLHEFIKARNWTPEKFVESFFTHPLFWKSIRQKTLIVYEYQNSIESLLKSYKKAYDKFKTPDVYFLIGYIETGGTTTQSQVLIGTEIAAGDSTVNTEGLHPLIQGFMQSNNGIMGLLAHELTHTQQKGGDLETKRKSNLLGFCIAEGMCEFIAEIITGSPPDRPYMRFGKEHDSLLWSQFRKEMHNTNTESWLYNGAYRKNGDADLGYYMGYKICKAYYQNSTDKREAIKEIIELNLEDLTELDTFLKKAGY